MDTVDANSPSANKLGAYPPLAKQAVVQIKQLMAKVAAAQSKEITESLKWGQLSFEVKGGTPLRLDHKKGENSVSIFCHCQTRIIDTFRQLYPSFNWIQTRELRLPINVPLPNLLLEQFIEAAFNYHAIKHLPLLGLTPKE